MKKKIMVKLLIDAGASIKHKDTFFFAFKELTDIHTIETIVSKSDSNQLEQYKKFIEKFPDNYFKSKTNKIIQNYELSLNLQETPKQKTMKI